MEHNTKTRVIKACLFDLDGTLIDTTADITTAINLTRQELELTPLHESQVALGIGHGASALLKHCLPVEFHEQIEDLKTIFIQAYRANLHVHTRFYDGAEEALQALKARGIKLGIVTNKPSELTQPLLEALGWAEGFDVVIGREADRPAKPHPDPIYRAINVLEVSPEETLYVGDSEVDAQAALAAGLEFLIVPYGRAVSDVHNGLYGLKARVMTWYDLRGKIVPARRVDVTEDIVDSHESEHEINGHLDEEASLAPSQELAHENEQELESEKVQPRMARLMLGFKNVTKSMKVHLDFDEALRKKLTEQYKEHFLGSWDILIIALSIYTLLTLIIQQIWDISDHHLELLRLIDQIVCIFFLTDFVFRLAFNKDRLGYLKWGWLDLISSIPSFESIRWGRTLRLIRLLRAIRAMRLLHKKLEHRLQDSFAIVLMSSFLMTAMSAISVLYLEKGAPNANISNPEDALWWAWVTITTVGYGDFYPVTPQGRILAMILMSAGVGLFSVLTVQCTRYFLDSANEEDSKEFKAIKEEVRALRELVLTLDLASRQRDQTSPLHTEEEIKDSSHQ